MVAAMRITKQLRSRLAHLFAKKMFQLGFDDNRPVSTWTEYLEGIGCRRVCLEKAPKGFVLIDDPIWFKNKIQVPRDLAMKALVMEWLP